MGNVQFIRGTPRRSTLGGVVQALQSGIQGYQGGQDRRMAQDKNSLANMLTMAKIQELNQQSQPIDPTSDLFTDPSGSGMVYSKSQRKWINPKAGQVSIFGGGQGGFTQQPTTMQDDGYEEGSTYEDDQTGEKFIYQNGQLVPIS